MAETLHNEREIAFRLGGTFANLKEFNDSIVVKRCPFNETQVLSGLAASTGKVIPAALIPANPAIVDNLKISDGLFSTLANQGGLIAAEGTITTGFVTPGTFVFDAVTVTDDYGNVLNEVEIRDASTHDSVVDSDGRKVSGLLVRVNGVADDTTIAANPNENLELCFIVNDGAGNLVAPNGGVTGSIEFNISRSIARRYLAKIALEGANSVDVDVIADMKTLQRAFYTVTDGCTDPSQELALGTGVLTGSVADTGTSTPAEDYVLIDTWLTSSAKFLENETVFGRNDWGNLTKGIGQDVEYVSAGIIKLNFPVDVADKIMVTAKFDAIP